MNKMFDGMMSGKPIIFAINAPLTPVEECDCGLIVKPENITEISEAIRKLMKMSQADREAMGLRGKEEVLRKYTYEKLANSFVNLIEKK